VGRLIERKGQHHLLRAFANVRAQCNCPITLTLVGTGDAEDSLHCLANDLKVADAVTFTGFVPRNDMPAVYRQTDIFVLPSQNEGMSIALLEAMASGLPVVVTDTGGTAELVQDEVDGYVVPWADVLALTRVLATLVQDEQLRQRMGKESRRVAQQFDWSSVSWEYLELYGRIAAIPRSVLGLT
jgi:glycosyltransferase involved in cell wall biosynthesis